MSGSIPRRMTVEISNDFSRQAWPCNCRPGSEAQCGSVPRQLGGTDSCRAEPSLLCAGAGSRANPAPGCHYVLSEGAPGPARRKRSMPK